MELGRIQARLRSEQGATILFALFFFIICAVVGSVVLTAGTAAAGRLSRAKQMDQRYYAVNSAAEMLEHELDREQAVVKVTTTEVRTDTITSTLTRGTGDNWTEANRTRKKGSSPTTSTDTAAGSASISTLLKDCVNLSDAIQPTDADKTRTIENMTLTLESDTEETLKTVAKVKVDDRYNLSIVLRDTIGDNEKQRYYLTLDCPAHVSKKKDVQEEIKKVEVTGSGDTRTRTETRTVTTTITETITWSVAATMKGSEA